MRGVAWLGLAVGLASCDGSETNVNQVYPDLVVLPSSVDFGEVAVDYSSGVPIQILNAGLAKLDITAIGLAGDDPEVFVVDNEGPVTLAKDESVTVKVVFAPQTYLPYAADFVVQSNDPTFPELVVPLTGTGVYAPTPDITLDPQALDFGVVAAGESAVKVVNVKNDGGSTLTLGAAEQHGSGAFSILGSDPGGFSIPPGQAQQIVWQYAPTQDGGDNGSFVIPSNDPDEPEASIILLGNGGGDFSYPEADIVCPPVIEPRQLIVLDGSGSSDPDGLDLDYQWTLDAVPAGSAVDEIIDDRLAISQFTTDIAGQYTVGLVVTNSNGVSSAKRVCKMEAIPKELLHVELSWNTNSADLDLHLIEGDGDFFHNPEDCDFCNQVPDWGTLFDITDDPSLDIDDQSGFGPENTNIDDPADGTYRVLVHYFADHGDGAVEATVRIYAYGVLISESTQSMAYNYTWEVGVVNWPDGTLGVTDVYRDNYLYDDAGNFLLDADGKKQRGPMQCQSGIR